MGLLGAHLYQCTSCHCCERLCLTLVHFFLRLFQGIFPFHDEWFMSTPAHTDLSVQQFLTKNSMTPCDPPSLFTQSCPPWLCLFVSLDEKNSQRETFCQCGRGEQKMAEALKGNKINEFKYCFELLKAHLNRCIQQRVLWRWLMFKLVRINTQFLYK